MKRKNRFKPRLILASASPRRKSLMREAGYRFSVKPSRTREKFSNRNKPSQIVQKLARLKAWDVSKKYPTAIVLGADTLVFLKGRLIGKPRNKKHARRILNALSASWQSVYTGVAVAQAGGKKIKSGYAVSKVKLRKLERKDVDFAMKNHMDKAGAYAVQQKNDPFVEKIVGDYDNVVGLPLRLVRKLLRLAL